MLNKKNKIERKNILLFLKKIKIRSKSFTFIDIIVLISIFILIYSIFIPWFSLGNQGIIEYIFSNTFGITGYISIFLILINLFLIFSNNTKQKIKLYFDNFFSDNSFFILSTFLFLILAINSFFILKNGINLFTNDVKIHTGIIFYLIGVILYSTGIFLKLKYTNTNSSFMHINESRGEKINYSKQNVKNIIKLPFE